MKKIAFILIVASLAGTLSCNRNDLYDNTQNEGESLLLSTLNQGLTVVIQSPVSGSTNAPIPITIVFKSPVTDFDVTDIIAGNGTVGGFAGAGDTYTAVITPLVDGDVTVDIPAGAAQDADGNLSKAARSFTAVYDTVVGLSTVTIRSNNPNGSLAVLGDRVTLSFTAGEPLNTPGVVINGVAATVTGGPVNWTAYRVMNAGDPEVAVTFTISGIQDLAGNVAADVSATTDASTVVYDMTAPTVDPVSIISSNPLPAMAIVGDTVTLSFTSDEDLQTPAVTINGAATTVAGGPVNWTATRVMAAGDPEGVVAFSISSIRDLAGNATAAISSTTDLSSVTLDRTAPRITSIDSITADGAYGTGANIDVTVNFDENVTLAGNDLELTLDTGAVVHVAPFGPSMSASGTYIVGAGESSGDLNVTNVALGGGATLTDAPGNSASLALPGSSNLANNSDIIIDTVPPEIAFITSGTSNGTYGSGANIDVTIQFTKNVTLAGDTMTVALDTGGTVTINPFGPALSASGTYTVAPGHASIDLNVTNVSLNGLATLRDALNNDASLGLPAGNNLADNKAIVIDTAVPYIISIISTPAAGTYGTGATIDVTVNFSDNLTLANNNMTITLDTVGTVTITPFGPSSNAMGTYTVAAGETSADLNVTNIALEAGATLRDGLNNDADLTLPAGNNLADNSAVIIDAVAPTIIGITSATDDSNPHGSGSNIDVRLMFSKNVTLTVGTLDVTLDTGVTVSINPFGPAMSANATYIVGAGEESSDLDVTGIALGGGGIVQDAYGNNADLSLPGGNNLANNKNLVVDAVAPIVTAVTIASDNADPERAMIGDTITVTFTVNEDLQAPTATIGGNFASIGGGPLVWTASYTLGAMGDGPASFQISNVRDLAGNTIADIIAVTDTSSVTVDNTPPSVTPVSISSSNADPALAKLGDTVTVTFTSNEDLQAPTATICGVGAIIGGGPLVWTAEHVMTITDAEGGVPFQISNLRDLTGNAIGNINAVTDGSSVTYDRTVPGITSVSITSSNANPDYAKAGDVITLTFSADEDIQTPTVAVVGNPADSVVGGPQNWTATYTMDAGDPEGTVTFSITNVRDLAGNMLAMPVNTVTDASSVTYYKTPPTLNPVHIASNNPNPNYARVGNTVTITFTADRAIQTPTAVIKGTAAAIGGGPLAWSATRTMGAGDTDGAVNFTISGIQDLAGNTAADVSSTTDASAVTFDKTPPVITAAGTMDADGNGRIDHYRVTLNENVIDGTFPGYALNSQGSMQNEWLAAGYTNLVMAHGTAAPEADTANDNVIYLKFSESMVHDTDAKPDLTTTVTPLLADRAGNPMTQVSMAAVVETDTAAPVVVNVVGPPGGNTAMVAFSEAVDGNGGVCDGASNLASGDFDYFNTSGGGATTLTGMSDGNACDGQAEVLTDAVFAPADMETDSIGPRMNQIYDAANNPALTSAGTIHGFLSKMVCRFDTTPDGADVPNDVMDFPLLIRLIDPAIIDAVQPGAPDIRFIDRAGTSLRYQVERWDQALDRAEVWVLVPQVDGNSTGDYITMYYDDVMNGTVPDGQDPAGVFDTANGYAGVWHLADGAMAGLLVDATANGNIGTNSGSTNELAGIIGLARSFDGSNDYVECPNDASLDITGQLTLSAWIRSVDGEFASDYRIISKKAIADGYELIINTQSELINLLAGSGAEGTSYADLSGMGDALDTGWHYLSATINGTAAEIFFDGLLSTTDNTIAPLETGSSTLVYGASSGFAYYFNGAIDEVRVEYVQRSPDWIKLCYENQRLAQRLIKFWYDPAWQYRKRITVQSAKVADDLLSFPVYLRLDDLGAEFFNRVKPDGSDIVVTAGNGRTRLPREVAAINTGMQRGEVWFLAPALLMGQDVSFYVYYGNASATEANDPAVWGNNYAGVWHLTDNVNPTDSSPNFNHGIFAGTPAPTAGQMGGAVTFNGTTDYVEIPSSATLDIAGDVTVSAWFKPALGTEPEMPVLSKRFNAAAVSGYEITADPSLGDLFLYTQSGSYGQADMAFGEISAAWFNYYAAVYNFGMPMGTCSLYFNGNDRTTDPNLASLMSDPTPLRIGSMPDDSLFFSGVIDEVRVSDVERSAGWVQTEYNNQSDPFTFFNFGAEEEVDSP
ncbi:MAG: DUF2341 domain-containing protein [Spirochaetes bacterium]|nr:DUF2341 domain-containing protein [Spirochaetota bacterium]